MNTSPAAGAVAASRRYPLFIGTYSRPILFGTGEVLQGKGEGIHLYYFDEDTGLFSGGSLLAGAANPSFLCFSPNGQCLYAVNELKEFDGKPQGGVSAYRLEWNGGDGSEGEPALHYLNTMGTGGTDPCHVATDSEGHYVFVANFMSGSEAAYPVLADGSLGEMCDFRQHAGHGPDPKRQAGPHAHSSVFTPDGRLLLVPDLGTDSLCVYEVDSTTGKLLLRPELAPALLPGAGPRFCEFHPGGRFCYLINELASSVSLLYYDGETGRFTVQQTVPTIPEGFLGDNICADLHLTPDGRFLYASNRGHNSLAAYSVNPADGVLTFIGQYPCGGATPRNFCLSPGGGWLLVANQDSDNLVSFAIHKETGALSKAGEIFAPTPVCVKPLG